MFKVRSTIFDPFTVQIHAKTSFQMKEGWLKILKPVTLEITIFCKKNQNSEWKTTLMG